MGPIAIHSNRWLRYRNTTWAARGSPLRRNANSLIRQLHNRISPRCSGPATMSLQFVPKKLTTEFEEVPLLLLFLFIPNSVSFFIFKAFNLLHCRSLEESPMRTPAVLWWTCIGQAERILALRRVSSVLRLNLVVRSQMTTFSTLIPLSWRASSISTGFQYHCFTKRMSPSPLRILYTKSPTTCTQVLSNAYNGFLWGMLLISVKDILRPMIDWSNTFGRFTS